MPTPIADVAEILERRMSGLQKSVVALSGAILFVEGINAQAAGYVAPALLRDWSLSPPDLRNFLVSGIVGLMFGGLLVAPLADKVGRRPILLACVALFGLCSIASGFAPSIGILNALRFATGLGVGGAMANAIALTAEYSPERRRSSMVAITLIGFIVGSVAIGLIAAVLVPDYGWQAVFIVGGALALLLLPLLVATLPESIRFLVLKENSRVQAARLIARIDPGLAIDANTRLVVEERSASGSSLLALFRDGRARVTILLWIIYFMSLLNLYLITSWLTIHITALGIVIGTAILISTMFQVGGAFGSIAGWVMDKIGASLTITFAYLIGAVSIACIGLAEANQLLLGAATLTAGFGIIGGQSATNALAAMSYPTQIRSTGVGWATGIGRVGSIVGPGLAGLFIGLGVSTQHVFYMAVVPALCASLAGMALGVSRRPLAAKESAAE